MIKIKKVSVLGAGIMGAGIAQVAAAAGLDVTIRDIDEELVEKGAFTGANLAGEYWKSRDSKLFGVCANP